jgi:uncharacterized protein (UPF0332 family)
MEAVNILLDNNKLAPSIHCAYYACLQMSKHVLHHFCYIDYDKQQSDTKGSDSHFYISDKTAHELKKIGHLSFVDYNKYYSKLKKLRKKSDYNNETITDTDANEAKESAECLLDILKKNFKY